MSVYDNLKKNSAVLSIVLLYIVVDLIMNYNEIYYLNLLPIFLIIVLIALVRLDIMYFIIIFLTPLSIPLIEYIPSSPIDFAIPTEPMLFGVMVIFIYKLIKEKNFDPQVLNHPVTYAIAFYLFWMFVTSITSSMPLVSFKVLLSRIWFLITFYLLAISVFRKTSNIGVFFWSYSLSMLVVVLYTIYRHLGFGLFDKEAAHFVMEPFFRDHTSYGAVLALLFFGFGSISVLPNKGVLYRTICIVIFTILSLGLILSYTRAAWLSVMASVAVLVVTLLRIKFKFLLLAGVIGLGILFSYRFELLNKMGENRQDSSAKVTEHVQSISNISSDDSNLERLNRWSAAFRMFKERPVFGWGPGTYSFTYSRFQLAKNKTLISTDFGDKGNAHSEYIGPLSESGFIGSLSFLLIVVAALLCGFRTYFKISDIRIRILILGAILGLITYLVHGVMNNFLDTDKISSLFWGTIAIIVSLDIYYLPSLPKKYNNTDTQLPIVKSL